jgi:hypothetical protein
MTGQEATRPDGVDTGVVCTRAWKHASGMHAAASLGGGPSLIRGGPRVYRYSISLNAAFEPERTDVTACGSGNASTSFRQSHGSYDVVAQINAHGWVHVELDFVRWQKAGELAFPLNRLEQGKGFVLDVKGGYQDNVNSSSGAAHIVFEPVRP